MNILQALKQLFTLPPLEEPWERSTELSQNVVVDKKTKTFRKKKKVDVFKPERVRKTKKSVDDLAPSPKSSRLSKAMKLKKKVSKPKYEKPMHLRYRVVNGKEEMYIHDDSLSRAFAVGKSKLKTHKGKIGLKLSPGSKLVKLLESLSKKELNALSQS